ncbi:MAG: hypothetical protein KDA55_14510, partial [Planctomycetales bacterium]|nr:hypothetical protein [Planctomycetales bacterium]
MSASVVDVHFGRRHALSPPRSVFSCVTGAGPRSGMVQTVRDLGQMRICLCCQLSLLIGVRAV